MEISTQSDLKQNFLAAKLEGAVDWAIDNRTKVLTAAGVLLGVILIASVLILRRNEQADLAWTRLAQAQAYLSQGQYSLSEQILTELKTSAPTHTSRLMATYYYAELVAAQKKYDEAVQAYSTVVAQAGKNPVRPLAMSALGFIYEEKKDYGKAAETYQQFLDQYSDHFMAARAQLALGRTHLLNGNKDAARKSLGQLIDLYPASEWAKQARELLNKIS